MRTTPREDAQLDVLRQGLRAWLASAADKGYEHELAMMALMLFTASGAVGAGATRQELLDGMGTYYDMYATNMTAERS